MVETDADRPFDRHRSNGDGGQGGGRPRSSPQRELLRERRDGLLPRPTPQDRGSVAYAELGGPRLAASQTRRTWHEHPEFREALPAGRVEREIRIAERRRGRLVTLRGTSALLY